MKITNKTLISTALIKRIMRLAQCQAEDAALIICNDFVHNTELGYYFSTRHEGELVHCINVTKEGDIITLGHELRHLAQAQRLGTERFNSTATQILEDDAEAFEIYLLNRGY